MENILSFLIWGQVNNNDNEPGYYNSLSIDRVNIKFLAKEKLKLGIVGAARIHIKAYVSTAS
jgi:hypothetical protein